MALSCGKRVKKRIIICLYTGYSLIKIDYKAIFSVEIDGVQDWSSALKVECLRRDKNDHFFLKHIM